MRLASPRSSPLYAHCHALQVEKLRARESELERELAAAKAQLPTWCQPVRVHESASANSLARPMSAASHATTGSKLDLHGLATASAAARPPSPATQAADGGGGGGWGLQGDSRGPSRELSSDRVMARGMSSGLPSSTEDYEALLAELARARADLVLLASKLEGEGQGGSSEEVVPEMGGDGKALVDTASVPLRDGVLCAVLVCAFVHLGLVSPVQLSGLSLGSSCLARVKLQTKHCTHHPQQTPVSDMSMIKPGFNPYILCPTSCTHRC